MAKGSVRKKGKKWYYRFYVEDASGNRIQKEFPGTESKNETESLLRKAMEDYENHNHRPCRWFAQAPLGPITS